MFSDVTGAGKALQPVIVGLIVAKEKWCFALEVQDVFGHFTAYFHTFYQNSTFSSTSPFLPSLVVSWSRFRVSVWVPGSGLPWPHVGVMGCRTRSVSSEHTAILFPFGWGRGPATLRDQSPAGRVTASQVNTPDTARL